MVNNFDMITVQASNYIVSNPVMFTIIPIFLGGLIYLFGRIRITNNWQYNTVNKEIAFLWGFTFLFGYFLMPILLIYAIMKLFSELGISKYFSILLEIDPIVYGTLLFLFLAYLESQNRIISQDIGKLKFNFISKLKLGLTRVLALKIFFYLINYLFIKTSHSILGLSLIVFFDLMIMSFWARLSNLEDQDKRGTIFLKENKNNKIDCRIIEQINNGQFIKIQKVDSNDILYIPTIKIERISTQSSILKQKSLWKTVFDYIKN